MTNAPAPSALPAILRRPLVVAVLVGLAGLAIAGIWLWQSAGASTLASEDRALADFRARTDAPQPPRPGVPRAGVYLYRQSGSEAAGGGALEISRGLPPRAVYVVNPTPEGYREDLRFSEEHVEEVRFAVGPEGTRALWRRTKVTFLGIGEDDRSAQTPPPLDHPSDLRPGAAWGGSYRSGAVPVTFRSRVVARETVSIDGRAVPVAIIRTESTLGGESPGTRTDEIHWAPSLSLPVRWSIAQSYGGDNDFRMTARLELESATPLT